MSLFTYSTKINNAVYILPTISVEWRETYGSKKLKVYSLAFEWLVWGFYIETK